MKKSVLLFSLAVAVCTTACSGLKKQKTTEDFANVKWELEYISGPKIAFEGLYTMKKPQITFNAETHQVSGNSGCNGYSASYEVKGNTISFGEQGPATKMFCEGGGEQLFLQTVQKVNSYAIDQDHKLLLKMDDVVMMRFKKVD